MIIYKIENKITKSVYIGQTNNFMRRMNEHKSKAYNSKDNEYNKLLYKKIREYGLENFTFEIIEEVPQEIVSERETYWINKYNSFKGKGYNADYGGQGYRQGSSLETSINDILYKLQNSTLTQHEIAMSYNVSDSVISNINNGLLLKQEGIIYPVRVNNLSNKWDELVFLLKETQLTFVEIANQLGVSLSYVKKINNGEIRNNPAINYPIRKISSVKQKAFVIQEMLIANKTNKEILAEIDTSIRTINRINYGETHYNQLYNYPLRQPCND